MTPKEKAEELINRFTFRCKECDYDWNAKKSALIAVDEIRSCISWNHYPLDKEWKFWEEVKQEIEKL